MTWLVSLHHQVWLAISRPIGAANPHGGKRSGRRSRERGRPRASERLYLMGRVFVSRRSGFVQERCKRALTRSALRHGGGYRTISPSADVRMPPAVANFRSDDGCDLLEAQPWAPGKELLEVAVADVDEYVRLYPAVREERSVDCCIVEAAHGTRIQPKGTKCHDEVGHLQGSVLVGSVIG